MRFVLTTHRADIWENALATRPGRVDLAIEIPRPDAGCLEQPLRHDTRDPSGIAGSTASSA